MITTLEGRMGQGKTLGMTALGVLQRMEESERAINLVLQIKETIPLLEVEKICPNLPPIPPSYQQYQENLTLAQYMEGLENLGIEEKLTLLSTKIVELDKSGALK